jgi:hypothetical protein
VSGSVLPCGWPLRQRCARPTQVPGDEAPDDLGAVLVADRLAEGVPQVFADGDEPPELDVPVGSHVATVSGDIPRHNDTRPRTTCGDIPFRVGWGYPHSGI